MLGKQDPTNCVAIRCCLRTQILINVSVVSQLTVPAAPSVVASIIDCYISDRVAIDDL